MVDETGLQRYSRNVCNQEELPQSSLAPTPEDIRDSDWQKILPLLAAKPGNRIMAADASEQWE